MKLYQLTTTAIITLVSILGNPLESLSQKKFFIPSALAQDSWVNYPSRIEITEKTSDREIMSVLSMIQNLWQFNEPISEADKEAMIEDLEKIEALNKNGRRISSRMICECYNIPEAWEKAVKACERTLKKGDVPDIFHPIHQAYFGAKQYNKAINYLKQSIKYNDNRHSYLSYQQLGLIYFKLGNYTEAARQYQKAIDSIHKYRDKAVLELSFVKSALGLSLLRQGKIDAAEKEFFEVMNSDTKYWNNNTVNYLNTTSGRWGGLWQGSLAGEVGIFTDGLTELRIKQGKYTEALEFSEYGRTRTLSYLINKNQESSITIDEIKTIAKQQNATLVKYSMPRSINYFGMNQTYEPQLYIWVVQPTGKVHFVNANFNEVSLANLSRNIFANLSRNTFANVRGNKRDNLPKSVTKGSCQNEDDCLKQAHKILIEPIVKLLPKNPEEEVIIIPDGELFRVPFAALKGSDNQYLIQKHTLRISPSIQLLQITQQQKAQKAPNLSNQNLVVGNPLVPKNHNGQRLSALPGAEKEAEAIAQLLNTTPITGRRATKSRITRLMSNANIIHLATHGTPSSLAFAPSGQDQGFLTEGAIYQLNLTADLVVLSAGETGLGQITTDGVVGIARPFVAAGVPSVVISLWQVPDATTSELMIDFHKNLQARQNKAQALRQAMLTTMKKHPEPVNWAGFFLVGES